MKKSKIKNQKSKISKIFFLTLFFILCFKFFTYLKAANAQSLSLSIWPPLLELTIQPGKTAVQTYKLTNNSDHELQIFPLLAAFEPLGETGQIKIIKEPINKNFFSFDSKEKFGEHFILGVGQTKELYLRIAIPVSAPERDYYNTLLFSSAEKELENLSGASSSTQIGSNILITVSKSDNPNRLGRILEFSSPKLVDSFSSVSFIVKLENWGKTFWKPFGQIKIQGMFGEKKEIPLLEQNVLSQSARKLSVSPFKPKWPIGLFKAKIEFSPDKEGELLSSETSFFYFPFKVFIFIFLGIVFGVFIKRIKVKQNTN